MQAASPRAAARIYGISDRVIRDWIKQGRVSVHACGRKSVVLFADLERAIREQPAPKSSRRVYNEQTMGVLHE